MNYGKDYSGQRFGRLIALRKYEVPDKKGRFKWIFMCDCDGVTITHIDKVISGHTRSCGCYNKDRVSEVKTVHGHSKTPQYAVWKEVHQRCNNLMHPRYKDYGGRGITVCERWKDYLAFYEDMGPIPFNRATLERINNNGNYEPTNCKWATYKEQRHNRRDTCLTCKQ